MPERAEVEQVILDIQARLHRNVGLRKLVGRPPTRTETYLAEVYKRPSSIAKSEQFGDDLQRIVLINQVQVIRQYVLDYGKDTVFGDGVAPEDTERERLVVNSGEDFICVDRQEAREGKLYSEGTTGDFLSGSFEDGSEPARWYLDIELGFDGTYQLDINFSDPKDKRKRLTDEMYRSGQKPIEGNLTVNEWIVMSYYLGKFAESCSINS